MKAERAQDRKSSRTVVRARNVVQTPIEEESKTVGLVIEERLRIEDQEINGEQNRSEDQARIGVFGKRKSITMTTGSRRSAERNSAEVNERKSSQSQIGNHRRRRGNGFRRNVALS